MLFAIVISSWMLACRPIISQGAETVPPVSIYDGDSVKVTIKGYTPAGQPVPYGTNVKGVYFDGYPQIVKEEGSKPF